MRRMLTTKLIEWVKSLKDYVIQYGNTTEIGGNAEIDGNLKVNGSIEVGESVEIGSSIEVNGEAVLNNDMNVEGDVTIAGKVLAKTLEQNQANYEAELTLALPNGMTFDENVYKKVVQIGNILHIIISGRFSTSADFVPAYNHSLVRFLLPTNLQEKIYCENGQKVSEAGGGQVITKDYAFARTSMNVSIETLSNHSIDVKLNLPSPSSIPAGENNLQIFIRTSLVLL